MFSKEVKKKLNPPTTRRGLLKASALAGGGLLLELGIPAGALAEDRKTKPLVQAKELNAYVEIAPSGTITIFAPNPEMGQGIKTTLPMIIAEEMGAKWDDVQVRQAPVDSKRFGMQGSGGSRSVPRNFDPMRKLGASAREMLLEAGAFAMEVDKQDLKAEDSKVLHKSGRSMTFGALATLAAEQKVPDPASLTFKDPSSYRIIGTSVKGVDNLDIVSGKSQFGIDVDVPGMQYASYTRCPRSGGTAESFNADDIKRMPGVVDAFILEPNDKAGIAEFSFMNGASKLHGGVAIVGEDTWSVLSAKNNLKVRWNESDAASDTWTDIEKQAKDAVTKGDGEVLTAGKNVERDARRPRQ